MNLIEQACDADLYSREKQFDNVIPTRALFKDVIGLAFPDTFELSPIGIYEQGHGGYKWTMSYWRRQREAIVSRLHEFEKNLSRLKQAKKLIEDAIEENKNGLPF
jgi:hypothetical protein